MLGTYHRPPTTCSAKNICEVTTYQAPACGRSPDHFPPELRAEDLCPWALHLAIQDVESRYEDYRGRAGQVMFVSKHFTLGSHYAELALAQGDPYGSPNFEQAAINLRRAGNSDMWRYRRALNASLLHLHLPYLGEGVDALDERESTHLKRGLLEITSRLEERPQGAKDLYSHLKLAFHMLHISQDKLVLPATQREGGHLLTGSIHENAHDFYTIENGEKRARRLVLQKSREPHPRYPIFDFVTLAEKAIHTVVPEATVTGEEAAVAVFNILYDRLDGQDQDESYVRVVDTVFQLDQQNVQAFYANQNVQA